MKDLGSLGRRAKNSGKMLIETFDEQYESGLYTPLYHIFDRLVDDIRRF